MRSFALPLLAPLLLAPSQVYADDEEWRSSLVMSGVLHAVADQGAEGHAVGPGGGLRIAYGLSNSFEVGARLSSTSFTLLELPDVQFGANEGDWFFNQTTVAIGLDLRWMWSAALATAFVDTQPLLGIRVGLLETIRSDQILRDDRLRVLESPPTTYREDLFVTAEVGVERRFWPYVLFGITAGVTHVAGYNTLEVALEASWTHY
jgi:hypothetical protein